MGEEFKQKKREGRAQNQSLKYLGVWFDTAWEWETQRKKIDHTLNKQLQNIREANIPLNMEI